MLPDAGFVRDVAAAIAARNGQPIQIAEILAGMNLPVTDNGKRKVKAAVEECVSNLLLPIASSKKKAKAGYRWCQTAEDRESGARELFLQGVTMIRRARVLVRPAIMREWLGQELLEGVKE